MRTLLQRWRAFLASGQTALADADPHGYWAEQLARVKEVARHLARGEARPIVAAQLERLRAANRRLGASDGRFLMFAAPVVAFVLALWMTVPDWGPRPPGGDDTLAHVIRAQFASTYLINHLHVDGWDPRFIVGYQEFLFNGPGLSWVVYLTRLLTLGTLSFTGAVKVVAVGSFVLTPLSVAFMARSFGLGRRAAGLSAILSLTIDSPFGGAGLQGLFGTGLITNQLGAVILFATLGGFFRVMRQGGARWLVFTGVSLGLLTITHGIDILMLGVFLVIVVVLWVVGLEFPTAPAFYERVAARVSAQKLSAGESSKGQVEVKISDFVSAKDDRLTASWPRLGNAVGAALLGFALAAVVLAPLFGLRNLRGASSGWSTPPLGQRLLSIWQGGVLLRPAVAPFFLAGAAYGAVRVWKARPYALPLVAAPIVFLIVAYSTFHYWPSSAFGDYLPNEGLGFDGVMAVLPLGALIARATRPFLALRDVAAGLLATLLVVLPMGTERQEAQQMPQAVPQMSQAAAVLHAVVPPSARFATERDVPIEMANTGVPQPDRWLAWASGRNTLDLFDIESSVAAGVTNVTGDITSEPPDEVADQLARLGVTDLVTISTSSTARIGASPRFKEIWQAAPFAIFKVLPSAGQPSPAELITADAPISAELLVGQPEHNEIAVTAAAPTTATVAIGYSPKWHATLDGKAVPLTENFDGMLQVALPAGHTRLDLRFEQDGWDYLGQTITVLTLLGLVVTGVRGRRRARAASRPRRASRGEAGADDRLSHTGAADLEPPAREALPEPV